MFIILTQTMTKEIRQWKWYNEREREPTTKLGNQNISIDHVGTVEKYCLPRN